MNKKGQYYPPPQDEIKSPFGYASPILILGIAIFVIPFFNVIIGWNLPKWISGIGIVLILIGALLSMIIGFNR